MNIGPRLTYYPSGVLLTAPYDAQLTPAMVGELKRLIPQHASSEPGLHILLAAMAALLSSRDADRALAAGKPCRRARRFLPPPGEACVQKVMRRCVPQHGRRYLPDTREWFIGTAYEAQARAIFRSCWPQFEEEEGIGPDPASQQPRDPRPPLAVDRHYAALHLLPSAPRELIESAYKTLVKLNHPDRLPVPQRDGGHRRMVAINGAYEALHAHSAGGD